MKGRLPLLLAATLGVFALAALAQTPAPSTPSASDTRFQIPATDDGLPGAGPIRRTPWFQTQWTERRALFATRQRQDREAVVFLGDSITQGWGNNIGGLFPGVKMANRGISGDTSRGVLVRLQEDVTALDPRGVVLLIGTNDLDEQAEPEVIAGNVKLIIAALKQHNPSMPVVLCNVFPSSATRRRPAEKIRKLNQLYFAAIKDEPQVTVIDTWSLFADAKGDAKPDEFPDLLHPNAVGYAKWATALRPILETVGLVPAWPDEFVPEPEFESLFNGRDFAGWAYQDKPAADGQTTTDDGRFAARNGRLIATVSRVERTPAKFWTTRQFAKDFVLKLEFRASPGADSGIYVRDPQLQCRDYLIAGPYVTLKNYRPLEWNEIVVTVKGGLAHATCNGEVLVDAMPVPPTGAIGIENDRGQMEYRRIRVQEAR